jgi:hypothetical protein
MVENSFRKTLPQIEKWRGLFSTATSLNGIHQNYQSHLRSSPRPSPRALLLCVSIQPHYLTHSLPIPPILVRNLAKLFTENRATGAGNTQAEDRTIFYPLPDSAWIVLKTASA